MRRSFPFTTLYVLLLLTAVVASWLVGLYGVDSVNSLLSGEGVRWWMRSVLPAFAASPIGEVLLVLFTLGAVRSTSPRMKSDVQQVNKSTSIRAWVVAGLVLAVLVSLVVWGVMSGTLLSVTGRWAHSPLQAGWLPVLALLVGIPCLCFALTNGTLTSGPEVLHAISSEVKRCAPAFVTLFVAAQLVAVLNYSHLPEACGIGKATFGYIAMVIYWTPFIYAYFKTTRI